MPKIIIHKYNNSFLRPKIILMKKKKFLKFKITLILKIDK